MDIIAAHAVYVFTLYQVPARPVIEIIAALEVNIIVELDLMRKLHLQKIDEQLEGIGQVLSEAIVDYRSENGDFSDIADRAYHHNNKGDKHQDQHCAKEDHHT